jgi:hypothetical protein
MIQVDPGSKSEPIYGEEDVDEFEGENEGYGTMMMPRMTSDNEVMADGDDDAEADEMAIDDEDRGGGTRRGQRRRGRGRDEDDEDDRPRLPPHIRP